MMVRPGRPRTYQTATPLEYNTVSTPSTTANNSTHGSDEETICLNVNDIICSTNIIPLSLPLIISIRMSEVYKYNELRRRLNFDELLTYMQKDKPTITLPTRMASILVDTQ